MENKGFTPGTILAKNTLINLAGLVIPIVAGIIAIPFAIKGLGTDGFGILSIVWVFLGYLGLLDFGLSRAITKFTAEIIFQKEHYKLSSIFWTTICVCFLLGLGGSFIVFFSTPLLVGSLFKIPVHFVEQTRIAFRYFSFGLPLILISLSLKGMLGAAQRFDLVNSIHIPASVLNFIFPALAYPFKWNLSTVILFIVMVRVVTVFFYLYYCSRIFPEVKCRPTIQFPMVKKLLSYGGWITVSGIVSPILVYMDRFFIGSILSMNDVTYYSAPFEAIHRLRIIPVAIMTTFFPEFSALASTSSRLSELIGRSLKYILIATGIVSIVLFFLAHDILRLWLGRMIAEKSDLIFMIFSFGILFNALAYIPFTVFQGVGRPDLPAKFHLIEFPIYFFLLWFCTQTFGIAGAAGAWFVRIVLDFLLLFVFLFKRLPSIHAALLENKIKGSLALLFVFGCLMFLMTTLSRKLFIKLPLLIVVIIVAAVSVWKILIDPVEKKWILSFLKR